MAHTFTNLLTHAIFSTKDRAPLLDAELTAKLFLYMIGILRELKAKTLAVNGVTDHVHLLVALPPSLSVADVMRMMTFQEEFVVFLKKHGIEYDERYIWE